jgi:Pyruvate/2-oxoacid:ferredoxin oxidoreductase delta subunit
MLASSGYRAEIDPDSCIACEACIPYCQFNALALNGLSTAVDGEKCMGCGVCVDKCAQDSIHLVRDPAKGEPLEIHQLMRQAAQQ